MYTPGKAAVIVNVDTSTTPSEVRSLLVIAQYISHFLLNFSHIVAPVRKLTHQDVKFKLGQREQLSFMKLMEAISKSEQ